ncbi:tetraspanin-11-like [Glandiceps talaboti]
MMSTVRAKIKKRRNRHYKTICAVCNTLLVILGVASMAIGLWIWFSVYNDPSGHHAFLFVQDTFWIANFLSIGIGTYIIIMACIGFFGIYRESKCSILVYFLLLLLVLIFAIAFTTMAFVFFFQLERDLSLSLGGGILRYYGVNGRNDKTIAIDNIQINFECCGDSSHSEWLQSEWYRLEDVKYFPGETRKPYPQSCCTIDPSVSRTMKNDVMPKLWNETSCYMTPTNKYMNQRGCFAVVHKWIYPYVLVFGGIGALTLLMLLADLLGYIVLLRNVDFDYYDDDASSKNDIDRELPPLDDADQHINLAMRKSAVPPIDFTTARKW